MQEVEELKIGLAELQHQVKSREQERDILTVMLNEMENAQRRDPNKRGIEAAGQQEAAGSKDQSNSGGWLRHFKGRSQ
jgi:hypothetical protein